MSKQSCVSVIVPVYNAECHIKTCLDVLLKQDFKKPYEIIMVDDASTDNSLNIVKRYDFLSIKLYSLSSNSGPAAARNFGLKKAKGEYIFFLDVDDTIAANTLSVLYSVAKESDCDLVMSDKKWIENSQNQRNNIFFYPSDQTFEISDIKQAMRKRYYVPSLTSNGLFDLTGKLIRRSIINKNNISLEEKLRYFEDEVFIWDVIAFVRRAKYVHEQLYSHYVHPNVNTAVSDGLLQGLPISCFKLIKNHIQKSLKQHKFSTEEIEKIGDQAFIFSIISALVSYSRSIILKKVNFIKAVLCRKKIITDVLKDTDVSKAIRNYSPSKKESVWIPRAICWRSHKLLEFACNKRAKEVLRIRRKNEA